jgi:3-(3-hydroxy-phenyl)propionate hydroxylase
MVPGAAAADAPVTRSNGAASWLLRELGPDFTVLISAGNSSTALARSMHDMSATGVPLKVLFVAHSDQTKGHDLIDTQAALTHRYDLRPDTAYLFRPDQHVCARWRNPTASQIKAAIARALAVS